ncbi:hypothetical protein [Legionella drozanskii]|uniref:NERD domain-containing protein n=1 Tax=Legionella drozanskii LLAP-1 TaxID=1212489 RepID=A0A0W0SKN2_9GAMM|nr:hypothetical protein [Legionella drozanskii]KTC83975.1 hypothetical protein Ldro_3095 [Legionella drozanskii LLAP-1]
MNLEIKKFHKLRDNTEEFLNEYLIFSKKHGFETALKQLKASDIVISRNKENRYVKLFQQSITALNKTFPSKNKHIQRLKFEAHLLQSLYKKIFSQIPQFSDKNLLAREKAGFLIFLENYLTVNRHIDIACDESQLRKYLLTPEIQASKNKKEYFNQWNQYFNYIEEKTREIRDILLYFHVQSDAYLEEIELSSEEVKKKEIYIPIIRDFWHLSHINELWCYADISIIKKTTGLITSSIDKKKYQAWMIANYRSRQSYLHRGNKVEKARYDRNMYMCSEYFYALPSEIFIKGISFEKWFKAYEVIKQFSIDFIGKRSERKHTIWLSEWFSIKSKEEWVELLKNKTDLSVDDSEKIFACLILNNDGKIKNKGDIFDHPFYKIGRNRYLLFSSIASQLDPIQCLCSLSRQYEEKIFMDNSITSLKYINPLEREVGLGLEKQNISFISNLFIEKEDGIVNTSNRKGEFDFIFQLENTLFFIECKRFLQPFYFEDYQELYGKLNIESKLFKSKVNYAVKQQLMFDPNDSIMKTLFSANWWAQKKIEKIMVTSSCLGEYMYMNGVHILDLEVFNAWLFNKEIVIRELNTDRVIQIIYPKQNNSLLQRFYSLQTEIPTIKVKRDQCTFKKKNTYIAGVKIESFSYEQDIADQFFV